MKVLLVGVGTVGEAIARLSAGQPWLERMVLADHDLDRARRIAQEIGDDESHPAALIDASDERAVEELARAHEVDLVMNAVDPRFVMPVFRGALAADADYMDLAVSTSEPHPTDPSLRVSATPPRRSRPVDPGELSPGNRDAGRRDVRTPDVRGV